MALTTGEKSALHWLMAVAVLGSGAQLYRHWRYSGDATPLATESLSRQLVAVDSAQRAGRRSKGARPASSKRASGARGRGGVASASTADGDTGSSAASTATRGRRRELPTLGVVDVDVADSAELERLPRIGPALAARIVADRNAKGPYGSLAGLQRVRGIGPKLAELLGPHVTFSGRPRPSTVQR